MKQYLKKKRIKLSKGAFRGLAKKVFKRDNWQCQWCNRQYSEYNHALQPHHVLFVSQGGDDVKDNLISLCWLCHRKLHDGHIPRDLKKEKENAI